MRRQLPIFYNALMLTGVNLLLRMVSTSFQVFISGRISAAGVGLLQLVMSVSSLSLTAGIAGIRTATMYLTAEELGKKKPGNVTWVLSGAFLYSIVFSVTIGGLVYIFAPTIAAYWIGDLRTVDALRLFAAFLPVTCLTGVMTGYFTAANRIGTLAAVEVAEQLSSMAATVAALNLWAGHDPGRACQATVFGSSAGACLTLLCLTFLRLCEKYPTGSRIPIARRLTGIALPLALADDLKAGISTTENLMVPQRLALYPGASDPLALFGTVCGMVFPVLMFPAAILFGLTELLIPELARCNAAGSRLRIKYLVKKSLRVALLYGVLCGGILFLAADDLCMALYGSKAAGELLRWFSVLAVMLYCDAVTDAMIKGLGQQKASVRYNILTSSMDVALLFALLPKFGIKGYYFSFLVTHFINFMLSIRRLLKITKIKIPLQIPAPTIFSAVFAVWAAHYVNGTAIRIGAFLLITICLLSIQGIISRRDLFWIKGLICKK